MLQRPSSASLCILRILGVTSHVHKNPPLIPFLSQMSPIYTLPSYPLKSILISPSLYAKAFRTVPLLQILPQTPVGISVLYRTTFIPCLLADQINRLTPNDPYMGRTAPLTSKPCILYIYSTNIGTEYFKHALYSPFFFLFKMQFVS